jgi:hypothetical protein
MIFRLRQIAKEIKLRPGLLIKFKFIERQASKGNVLARQYLEKLRTEEVSIEWAPSINQQYSSAKNVKDDGNCR